LLHQKISKKWKRQNKKRMVKKRALNRKKKQTPITAKREDVAAADLCFLA